ncbi:MAG TPA: hypothetical protein VF017_05675 [Thermoanaerobaculia bacterium]|nr:hypothetical protein [Thermoanaerobaculia bacterium]
MDQLAGLLPSSLLSTLLALAATFLGLAAAVQILQESYKYLSWSEARIYRKVLVDLAGPWIERLFEPGMVKDLAVRGPFQLRALRPPRVLLPLAQDELREATERLAPAWVREVVEQLRQEREVQAAASGLPIWSPAWAALVEKLRGVDPGDPAHSTAGEILAFLDSWSQGGGDSQRLDARTILVAFEQRFLPQVVRLDKLFPRLERNLGYANRRRNLRHTFSISLLLAVGLDLPFDALLKSASSVSLEDSVALAEARIKAYETLSSGERGGAPEVTRAELERQLQELVAQPGEQMRASLFGRAFERLKDLPNQGLLALPIHLLYCLVTAFMVSFGAPLWHNLTGALWRAGRARLGRPVEEASPAS